MRELRVGIDIGGTFTDFVVYEPGNQKLETFKMLSTPLDPSEVVIQGLERIRHANNHSSENSISLAIIHGSTIATNALLERKGAVCALVTSQGFKDILQIGRQNRSSLYNLSYTPPPEIIPAGLRFEIDERIDQAGQVIQDINLEQVNGLIPKLRDAGVESIAICFLFSFLHPQHESLVAACLASPDWLVSTSSEILPEFREYERMSTTVINAYVTPILDRYLANLRKMETKEIRVMQSNGGSMSLEEARQRGVHCILSGPAGGVIGAQHLFTRVKAGEKPRLITFDMGGTSTDVSLVDGRPHLTYEAELGGYPIHIPLLDIHTIGAGGGSIAHRDDGGSLRVGPQSAGANPGPACYGRNPDPERDVFTVTDANLALGRLAPELFLGGELILHRDRSLRALDNLAKEFELDLFSLALGVLEVVCTHMERATRLISIERGYDPRDFALLSFGGAGGLHAVDLARRCGIPEVIIPPLASTLSAFGMLAADITKDYSRTVMLPGNISKDEIENFLRPLLERGRTDLLEQGVSQERICLETALDVRFLGQSYELTVPFTQNYLKSFHEQHVQMYGYTRSDAPVEIVTARVRAVGSVDPPVLPSATLADADPSKALLDYRRVGFEVDGRLSWREIPFYRFEHLKPGNFMVGPSVVVRKDTTVWLGMGDDARMDEWGNLRISIPSGR